MQAPEIVGDEPIRTEAPERNSGNETGSKSKNRLLIDYIMMLGFNVLSIAMSFLNTSIVLSLLGRADYGEIVGMVSTSLIVAIISTDWTLQAMVRYGTAEYLDSGRISVVFWSRLFMAGCCVLAVSVILPVLYLLAGQSIGLTLTTLTFVLAYLPLQVYWLQIQRILPSIGYQRFVYPFLCLERSLLLCTIGVCYLLDRLSITNILMGYFIGCLSVGILSTSIIRSTIGIPRRPDRDAIRKILKFSWPLLPTVSISALSTNALDYMFVRKHVGTAQLGVYSLGVQIAGMVQQLPQIAGTLAMPRVIALRLKNDETRLARFVRHDFVIAQWLWTIGCFVGATLFAWQGPKFIPPNYGLLTDLVWPLAIVTSLLPVWYVVWNPMLTAFERTRTIMWAGVVAGLTNLAANAILIPRIGAIGSAWATVLSFAMTPLTAELLISRTDNREIPRRGFALYLPTLAMMIACLLALQLRN